MALTRANFPLSYQNNFQAFESGMVGSSLLPTHWTISIVQPKTGTAPMRVYVSRQAMMNFLYQALSLQR